MMHQLRQSGGQGLRRKLSRSRGRLTVPVPAGREARMEAEPEALPARRPGPAEKLALNFQGIGL